MSSNNSDCPYHSKRWRSLVQQTINCLRQDKLMEGRHCRTFPRLVCTCPDKVSSTFKAPQVSKESIDVWYEQVSCQSTAIGQSLKEIISALYVAAKSTENNLLLVINIIYLVYHGKTSCFDPLPKDSIEPVTALEEPTEHSIPPVEKVFFLDIPVTPTQYIGTLIGSNGVHLKKLCETYGITKVHLGEQTTTKDRKGRMQRPLTSFVYNSPVKVTYQVDEGGSQFETAMRERAALIKESREKCDATDRGSLFEAAMKERAVLIKESRERHFKNVQDFQKMKETIIRERIIRIKERKDMIMHELVDAMDVKLAAKGNYMSGKQGKDKKRDENRREKPTPVLADSHCLHCLMPYSPDTTCRYHPGYIVLKKRKKKTFKAWNCCNSKCKKDSTPQENHVKTGCSTGQHIWRPHTTKKTKATANADPSIDDIILQPIV